MNDMVRQEPQQMQALRPKSYGQIIKLAQMACESGMVPKAFANEPHRTAVAMMMLAENDLPVITGLKYVAVINGQPAFYSDAVPGIARKRGLIKHRREWFEGAGETLTAHCEVVNSDGDTFKSSFGVTNARRANLWGKDTYKQYPERMLMWRARSYAIRDAAPDAFMGPTVEELEALAAAFVGPDHAKEINPPQQAETPANNSPLTPQIRPERTEAPRAAEPEPRQEAPAPEPVAEAEQAPAPADEAPRAARRGRRSDIEIYRDRIASLDDAGLTTIRDEDKFQQLIDRGFGPELEKAIERREAELDAADLKSRANPDEADEDDVGAGKNESTPEATREAEPVQSRRVKYTLIDARGKEAGSYDDAEEFFAAFEKLHREALGFEQDRILSDNRIAASEAVEVAPRLRARWEQLDRRR
jgi:hypothetical protein